MVPPIGAFAEGSLCTLVFRVASSSKRGEKGYWGHPKPRQGDPAPLKSRRADLNSYDYCNFYTCITYFSFLEYLSKFSTFACKERGLLLLYEYFLTAREAEGQTQERRF